MARPSKDNHIIAKINTIVGSKVITKDLASFCNCSYPTIINFIKSHPERFSRLSRGVYVILQEENNDVVTHQSTSVSLQSISSNEHSVDPVLKYVTQQFDW